MLLKKLLTAVGLGLLCLSFSLTPIAAQDSSKPTTGTDGLPWWNDRVFYEVFVRSFQDSNGDGIGDLKGLINKLDYLNDGNPDTKTDLGVTGLWLMPIMESPSYHGYDVTDYMQVEHDYGTNDDFKQLMQEAHKRGIAVIIDMVLNHTSSQHPWFIDSQTPGSVHDQWYRWSDTKPLQLGPWNETVWYPLNGRYYYAVFWDGMPDLNYRNPEVVQASHDIAKFWLADMGADGFRMDGARYYVEDPSKLADSDSNMAWARDWHKYVNSVNPNTFTVAELWTNSSDVAKYMPDGFDMGFEFDLAAAMLDSARRGTNEAVTPVQARTLSLFKPGQYAPFLTNHDGYRLMNEMGKNPDKVKVAASMLLTGGGVPFMYYGEEIGMIGGKPDECIRTPMQWDSTLRTEDFMTDKDCSTNEEAFNVAAEDGDPASLLNQYRTLIHLRNEHSALRVGTFIPVISSNKAIYSFIRQSSDEKVLVVINLGKNEVADYKLSAQKSALKGNQNGVLLLGSEAINSLSANADGGFDGYTPLATLAPFSTTIIQLNDAK